MITSLHWSERDLYGRNPLDTFMPADKIWGQMPYISKVDENLYLGGVNPTLVLPAWIEYVVSLHPVEYRTNHELAGFAAITAADSKYQDPHVFLAAADVTRTFWTSGPTLVHCSMGLNRSAATVALAMMAEKEYSSFTAIGILRAKRDPNVLFNRHFEEFVRAQDAH